MAQTKYTIGETSPFREFDPATELPEALGVDPLSVIVEQSKPLDLEGQEPAIYVLLHKGRAVYVGQTLNVSRRLLDHSATKLFDAYWSKPVPLQMLNITEARFIVALNPALNRVLPSQYEFMSRHQASEYLGSKSLKEAIKEGYMFVISLALGDVFFACDVIAAGDAFGTKSESSKGMSLEYRKTLREAEAATRYRVESAGGDW